MPKPGASPFSGAAASMPKLKPSQAPVKGGLQSPEFLARHPSTKGVLEGVEAQAELAGQGSKDLAIANRFGMGGSIKAQQAANANAPRLREMARSMGIKESALRVLREMLS